MKATADRTVITEQPTRYFAFEKLTEEEVAGWIRCVARIALAQALREWAEEKAVPPLQDAHDSEDPA